VLRMVIDDEVESLKRIIEEANNVDYLLNMLDAFENTILHWACWFSHVEMITMLISKGACIDRKNKLYQSPFFIACIKSNSEVISIFLRLSNSLQLQNALEIETKNRHLTPMLVLCSHRNSSASIVKELIKVGADPFALDSRDESALVKAARVGNKPVLDIILGEYLSETRSDKPEESELHVDYWQAFRKSVAYGHWECTCSILECCENPKQLVNEAERGKGSALMIASYNGDVEMVNLLLEYGAIIDDHDSQRHTALALAILRNNGHVASKLVSAGARTDLMIRLDSVETSLQTAFEELMLVHDQMQ